MVSLHVIIVIVFNINCIVHCSSSIDSIDTFSYFAADVRKLESGVSRRQLITETDGNENNVFGIPCASHRVLFNRVTFEKILYHVTVVLVIVSSILRATQYPTRLCKWYPGKLLTNKVEDFNDLTVHRFFELVKILSNLHHAKYTKRLIKSTSGHCQAAIANTEDWTHYWIKAYWCFTYY